MWTVQNLWIFYSWKLLFDKAMHANVHAHAHMRETDTKRECRGIGNFKKLSSDFPSPFSACMGSLGDHIFEGIAVRLLLHYVTLALAIKEATSWIITRFSLVFENVETRQKRIENFQSGFQSCTLLNLSLSCSIISFFLNGWEFVCIVLTWSMPFTCLPDCSINTSDTLWQMNLRSRDAMESGPYPVREGEPECSYYIRTGLCRFGVTCRFNHPPNRKLVKAVLRLGNFRIYSWDSLYQVLS